MVNESWQNIFLSGLDHRGVPILATLVTFGTTVAAFGCCYMYFQRVFTFWRSLLSRNKNCLQRELAQAFLFQSRGVATFGIY